MWISDFMHFMFLFCLRTRMFVPILFYFFTNVLNRKDA